MRTKWSGLLVASALAFAGLATVGTVAAQAATCTTSWKSPASGDWNVAANWTNGVPASTSDACITLAGTYTVTISATGQKITTLHLGGSSGSQLLDVKGSCVANTAVLAASGPSLVGHHGTLAVDAAACDDFINFASPITNHGVLETEGAHRADVLADIVNDGTIAVGAVGDGVGNWQNAGKITIANDAYLQMSGTGVTNDGRMSSTGTGEMFFLSSAYTQGTGSIVGKHTVVMSGGTVTYAGTGPGTVAIEAGMTQIVGNISAGQTLLVEATCTTHGATAFSHKKLTNRGTILLEPDSSPCSDRAQLTTSQLVNKGTVHLATSDGKGGTGGVQIFGPIVNDKKFTVDAGITAILFDSFTNAATGKLGFGVSSASSYGNFADHAGTFTLGGTLTIATSASYWPAAGLDFHVITGGTRTGTFATVNGTSRAGEAVHYSVLYDDPTASDAAGVSLTTS